MAATREVKGMMIGGKPVIVREMTVAEIRDWLASKTEGGDLVDSMLFEEFSLSDIPRMSTLTDGDLGALAPSEIKLVMADAKEVNQDFFAMRARVVKLGETMMARATPQSDLPAVLPV